MKLLVLLSEEELLEVRGGAGGVAAIRLTGAVGIRSSLGFLGGRSGTRRGVAHLVQYMFHSVDLVR